MGKRKKPSKATESGVLTQCARRCCLCFGLSGDDAVKAGQIAHLDDDPSNNDRDNLAWLCLDHHAQWHTRGNMTKGLTADEVKAYRARLHEAVAAGTVLDEVDAPPRILKLHPTFHTTTGDRSTVINAGRDVNYHVPRGAKAPPVSPPPDAIGANIEMRSYIEYLVGRYIEWRKHGIERGIDRRRFFPGIMNNLIKAEFGARANLIAQDRFDDVVAFVQRAIDNTIWGRNSRHRNYHSFGEHCAKLRG